MKEEILIPFEVNDEIRMLLHKSGKFATDAEIIEWALMILKMDIDNLKHLEYMAQFVS